MVNYRIILLSFIIVILFFLTAIVYLFLSSPKKPNSSNTTSPSPTQTLTSLAYHIPTLNSLPSGTLSESANGTSFVLLAKMDSVSTEANGNIKAHISYNIQNGEGKNASTDILLYSTDSVGNNISITYQRTAVLFPVTSDTKTTTMDVKKDLQQFLDILQKYKNTPILLTFLSNIPNSSKVKKTPIPTSKQIQFVTEIQECNTGFLTYLKTGSTMPPCIPYTSQLGIYDPSL